MSKRMRMLCNAVLVLIIANAARGGDFKCVPTPEDSLGPFYKPDAPIRSAVGSGYVLSGTVRAATDCSPVPGARIELWLASADGRYDDDHRATLLADESGTYRFASNLPPKYNFRPPHIHVRVTAEGFKPLVAQHYPKAGASEGDFPLVLAPR